MRILFSLLLSLAVLSFSQTFDSIHNDLLVNADASVEQAAVKAQQDPLKPLFHLATKANWINDPNGPVYFKGEYHMFFQHNPYGDKWGNMSWGHAVSKDMVTWQHLPIALTPNPESYDKDGVFSGCCVIDNGVPTIIYTGVNPEVQCIARSYDNMRTWIKYDGNPVIPKPPVENVTGFRDPFVWQDGDEWYMVIGSGIKDVGGTAFLYKSTNLTDWVYINPISTGFGSMWECPNFFTLGEKWLLAVSPYGKVQYTLGEFKDNKFTHGSWKSLDIGGRSGFYAPNCLVDEQGRRIMWGWITGGGTEGYPWNGMLTLPRVLTLRDDQTLGIEPLPELSALRGKHSQFADVTVGANDVFVLPDFSGNCFEIITDIDIGTAHQSGLDVLYSEKTQTGVRIEFDNKQLVFNAGNVSAPFQLLPYEKTLRLHIFVDRSVVECYINGRECATIRTFPGMDMNKIRLFSNKYKSVFKTIDIWEMNSIYQ